MRSYGQYCALAKALDVIGDRWTLLIVRELLIRDGCRYTDLRYGLPGIATNLLADRLRELEDAGIVYRTEAPPPIATTLFQLTSRGKELEPVVQQLGSWGAPLLPASNRKEAFRAHWMALPLKRHLRDHAPDHPPVTMELRTGDEPLSRMTLEASAGSVQIRLGAARQPDAVVTGAPQLILGLLLGKVNLQDARASGLQYEGDPAVLCRLLPETADAAKRQES